MRAGRQPIKRRDRGSDSCREPQSVMLNARTNPQIPDHMGYGFFSVDKCWRFTNTNACADRIWGRRKEALLGKVIWEEFPQVVGTGLFHHMRRASQQQRRTRAVTELPFGHWVEIHIEPHAGGLSVHFRLLTGAERNRARRSATIACKYVAQALEEERQRLARELHDAAGQSLTALSLGLRSLEDLRNLDEVKQRAARLRSVAAAILDELGYIARGLHIPAVQELGLAAALQRFLPEFSAAVRVQSKLLIDGLRSLKLDVGTEVALYRIVQEAMVNVAKHAHATRAQIAFEFQAPRLQVTIRDNGRGFSLGNLYCNGNLHLGLRTMRERAEMLGGTLRVQSAPGSGTVVRAVVPIAPR